MQSNNQLDGASTENKKVTGTSWQAAANRNLSYSPKDRAGVPQIKLSPRVRAQNTRVDDPVV